MDNKNNLNPIRGSPNLLELISKKQEKDKQVFLLSKNRSKSMSDLSSLDESETDNTILLKQQSFLNNNNNTKILNMNYVELIRKFIQDPEFKEKIKVADYIKGITTF